MTNLEWLIKGSYIEAYDDNKGCKLIINGKSGKLKALQNTNQFDVLKWLLQEYKEPIKLKQWEYDLLSIYPINHKFVEFDTLLDMQTKGYYKSLTDVYINIEDILKDCEIVSDDYEGFEDCK